MYLFLTIVRLLAPSAESGINIRDTFWGGTSLGHTSSTEITPDSVDEIFAFLAAQTEDVAIAIAAINIRILSILIIIILLA
jgi:hypothetical protein